MVFGLCTIYLQLITDTLLLSTIYYIVIAFQKQHTYNEESI